MNNSISLETQRSQKGVAAFFALMALECAGVLVFYLTLPGDPKNAAVLGMSYFRLALVAASLLLVLLFLLAVGLTFRKQIKPKSITARVQSWAASDSVYGIVLFNILWLISSVYMYLRWFYFDWIATDMQIRVRPFLTVWILLHLQMAVILIYLAVKARPRSNKSLGARLIDLAGKSKQFFLALIVFTAMLYVISVIGQLFRFFTPYEEMLHFAIHEFHLDDERNLPTYFSMSLMITSAILMVIIGIYNWVNKKGDVWHWLLLALIFCFMSVDEYKEYHEQLGVMINNYHQMHGFLAFAWYIPVIPALVVLFFAYLRFLKSLPKKIMNNIILGGVMFVGGAIGFKSVGSELINETTVTFFQFVMLANVEETVELLGLMIFIRALLSYIALHMQAEQAPEAISAQAS